MPNQQRQRARCNLLLHQGAMKVDRQQVVDTPTPDSTLTWQPIPHVEVLREIEKNLEDNDLHVVGEAHGLSHDGKRYFGLLEIESLNSNSIMSRVVGVRNAHDKRFAAGIVAGAQVLVCDNLCFAGDIALSRKHTSHILDDLPELARNAVIHLKGYWDTHGQRVAHYKSVELDDPKVHDLLIKAVDSDVMSNSYIPKVLEQWREPQHDTFKTKNYWSLQNCFTEVFKGRVDLLPERTGRLHDLLDAECDFKVTS